jgi:trk system potassium uptake protein TrkH
MQSPSASGNVAKERIYRPTRSQTWHFVVSPVRRRKIRRFSYIEIFYTYVAIALVGTVFLALPVSSQSGQSMGLINALFMATSALTTTGLAVVDPGSMLTLFGQLVLLALIQIGGLGYMVFVMSIFYARHKKPSMKVNSTLRGSIAGISAAGARDLVATVLLTALITECLGFVLLSICFAHDHSPLMAMYLGLFHSVSAFCTAGFSLFTDNFISYSGSVPVNLILSVLSIIGSIGFFVIYDIFNRARKMINGIKYHPLSVHTKLVLYTSFALMLVGAVFFFFSDTRFYAVPLGGQVLQAVFQAVSASTTTGFNTINIGALGSAGVLLCLLLMFIGSAPGGTGGGIKTTTFALNGFALVRMLKGVPNIVIFKRKIPQENINQALTTGLLATLVIFFGLLALLIFEKQSFVSLLFEIVSAFGTVGLSTGVTPSLTIAGKIILCGVMLIGRVGLLTIGLGLLRRQQASGVAVNYAETEVFVS